MTPNPLTQFCNLGKYKIVNTLMIQNDITPLKIDVINKNVLGSNGIVKIKAFNPPHNVSKPK